MFLRTSECYHRIAEENNNEKYTEILDRIIEQIEEASKNGFFYCNIKMKVSELEHHIIEKMILKTLKENGFVLLDLSSRIGLFNCYIEWCGKE